MPVEEIVVSEYVVGFQFRFASFWIGDHYSRTHKRHCINILPCCTIWIVQPGGHLPKKD